MLLDEQQEGHLACKKSCSHNSKNFTFEAVLIRIWNNSGILGRVNKNEKYFLIEFDAWAKVLQQDLNWVEFVDFTMVIVPCSENLPKNAAEHYPAVLQ